MKIDLSKLSPMARMKLCSIIIKESRQMSRDMDVDIEFYSDGPVKNEMIGWRNALAEVASTATQIEKA